MYIRTYHGSVLSGIFDTELSNGLHHYYLELVPDLSHEG